MVDVTVKVFGPLKDVFEEDEFQISVPPPFTGNAAFETLVVSHPGLREWRPSVKLAVNLEYVSLDHVLQSGDEISFVPPVSGG